MEMSSEIIQTTPESEIVSSRIISDYSTFGRIVFEIRSHASAAAPLAFEGTCPGRILEEADGTGGFGYDPVF